jgi:hypothetical protein
VDEVVAFIGEGIHQRHVETSALACLQEKFRRAASTLAEVKVVAGHDAAGMKLFDQNMLHEVFRRPAGEFGGERLLDYRVKAHVPQDRCLFTRVSKPVDRLVRLEETARMRLECQHDCRQVFLGRDFQRPLKHGLMSAMNTIKIADGHHAIAQALRQGVGSRKALEIRIRHSVPES